DRPTTPLDAALERREILTFAVAAGDEYRRPADTFEGRKRRGDRRSLRVVHEQHATDLGDPLHAMRQSREPRERAQHVPIEFHQRGGERQRGEGIERVVSPDEGELALRKQKTAAASEPRLAIARDEAPVVLALRRIRAEGLDGAARNAHRPREWIVAVQHLLA